MNSIGYCMGLDELILLCSLKGCKCVKGLLNYDNRDILKKFTEDGEKSWISALHSLEQKEYVSVDETGRIAIDKIINFIVNICCRPEFVVNIETCDKEGSALYKNCYFTATNAIEIESGKKAANNLILTPHETFHSVMMSICENIGMYEMIEISNQKSFETRLQDGKCMAFLDAIEKADAVNIKQILQGCHMDNQIANVLAKSLVNRRNIQYISIYKKTGEDYEILGSIISVFMVESIWHIILIPEDTDSRILIKSGGYEILYDSMVEMINNCNINIITGEVDSIE